MFLTSFATFDEIIKETQQRLTSQNVMLSKEELESMLKRVMEGQEFLGQRYTQWWHFIPRYGIDFKDIEKLSPLALVLHAFGLTISLDTLKEATVERGLCLVDPANENERIATNVLWDEVVSQLILAFPRANAA